VQPQSAQAVAVLGDRDLHLGRAHVARVERQRGQNRLEVAQGRLDVHLGTGAIQSSSACSLVERSIGTSAWTVTWSSIVPLVTRARACLGPLEEVVTTLAAAAGDEQGHRQEQPPHGRRLDGGTSEAVPNVST
jgi:hypothetical protein